MAIGQPDGKVTVVDLDGSLHAEFDVYEAMEDFRWCDILINENYIVCASTESNRIGHEVKIFSHTGKRLKGRVHDVRALELRPEIFSMGYFWGELSDYDTVISLRRFIYTVRPTYSDIRISG